MKILHVATFLSEDGAYGGPISVAIEQMRELARLGHEVHFVAGWDGRGRLSIPGVHVHLFRARGVKGLRFSGLVAPRLLAHIAARGRSFDVAHIHLGRDLVTGPTARALLILGVPLVTQTHGMVRADSRVLARVFDLFLTRTALRKAQARLILTPDESQSLRSVAGVLDNTMLRNAIRQDSGRRAKPMPDTPTILFLARLHPRKRVMAFAHMARILHERGITAEYKIVGPDEGDLPELTRFMQDHPWISMYYDGPAEPGTAIKHFETADVYVLPSVGEVYPMTVIEAVASRVPVVMTEESGMAPDIANAGAGIVTGTTPGDLALGVERIVSEPGLRKSIEVGQAAAMIELFNITGIARELENVYEGAETRSVSRCNRSRPRLLWMTNTAAPYRVPVWNAIAKEADLEVLLLENSRRLSRDGSNRGSDWRVDGRRTTYRVREVPTLVVRRGEARHYFPLRLNLAAIARADAILLGGWDSPAYLLALLVARACRTKTIGFYESHSGSHQFNGGPVGRIRQTFFRLLDEVVVPGQAARHAVLAMGVGEQHLRTGFNAVDGIWIHDSTSRIRMSRGASEATSTRFLAISQLIERKNLQSVLTALSMLDDKRATLEIVGVGPQLEILRALSHKLGLDHRVQFTGHVPYQSLPDVFARADTLVHVPTEEVWGLVVNEALAAGLSVIVSQECGVTADIKHMQGVTVTESDAESIQSAMNDVSVRQHDHDLVANPEILKHSPEAFAEVFLGAIPRPRDTIFVPLSRKRRNERAQG